MDATCKRIVQQLRDEITVIENAITVLQPLLEEKQETQSNAQNHK